jgi:hypothetical protein
MSNPGTDALSEATAIAKSAAGKEINWDREPLTDYEGRLRAFWIKMRLKDIAGCVWIRCTVRAGRLRGELVPSDLLAADVRAKQRIRELIAILDREQLREVRAEFGATGDAA